MATQPLRFDEEEQRVRIRRSIEEARKFSAEVEKLCGELKFQRWSIFFQGLLAATAVIGAGVAIAKLFIV